MSTQANLEAEKEDGVAAESIWMRGLYMLLFVLIYGVAEAVVFAVALLQFGWKVLREETNDRLTDFADGLARFVYQIVRYWTFLSDEKPYPFSDWPRSQPGFEEK